MDKNYIFIGMIIIFLVITGMFVQKSYNLFATLPVGQFIQFRTTSLSYASGSAIAFTTTCGNELTAYGYVSATHVSNECENDGNHGTLIMQNLPGTPPSSPVGDGNWKLYHDASNPNTKIWMCQNDLDGSGSVHKSYLTTSSDAPKVSIYKTNSIDPTLEIICGSCTPDNSCAANTCIGSTCINNCGTVISGTKTCITNCLLQDINNNGKVDRDELGTAITNWVSNM